MQNDNQSIPVFTPVKLFYDIQYGGITLEYSGSDASVERINSSKPLKKDLVVEVFKTIFFQNKSTPGVDFINPFML